MTTDEASPILHALVEGRTTPRGAIAQLISGGMGSVFAEHLVFITLGGDDIVGVNKDGKKYYSRSGVTVEEMNRLMAK